MRIVVIGAYGLLGGYVTARLLADGHDVVGVGRSIEGARRRFPAVKWVKADLRTTKADGWRVVVRGADALMNCAGALQDSPRDDLDAVHAGAVSALAEACREEGVRRFVHISAVGVDAGEGRFGRTKLEAEKALRATRLEWVILRPALVLAPAAYGGSALLRGLAGFPGVIPAIRPDAVVQTISVDDVVEAVVRSVRPGAPSGFIAELTADEQTRLRDVLTSLRGWLGLAPARVIALPEGMGRISAVVADGLGWLGWRSAMRSAAIEQLSAGVVGRAGDAMELLGFRPRRLTSTLADLPSGVQDRWFARLYFLKPMLIVTLSLFWMASGVIGLIQQDQASRLLTGAAVAPAAASLFVIGGAVADIALALLVCVRRTAAVALWGMLLLTIAYLGAATFVTPHLWADPLGPLVKSIPAAILALVALAMMEER